MKFFNYVVRRGYKRKIGIYIGKDTEFEQCGIQNLYYAFHIFSLNFCLWSYRITIFARIRGK